MRFCFGVSDFGSCGCGYLGELESSAAKSVKVTQDVEPGADEDGREDEIERDDKDAAQRRRRQPREVATLACCSWRGKAAVLDCSRQRRRT